MQDEVFVSAANMLNIGIITDSSWDNFILIEKKVKKINSEYFRVHTIYNKNIEIVRRNCSKHFLTLMNNSGENVSKTISNVLKICDIWLIFTNRIEYLNIPSLVIDKCDEFNIKYIVISEHSRENDYYSFESEDKTFKKMLNNLTRCENKSNVIKFNDEIYNEMFYKKNYININLTEDIKNKIRKSYETIETERKSKSIQLLYDKSEMKSAKAFKKTNKECNQLSYGQSRLNYYQK